MKTGDLVFDKVTGDVAIIVSCQPEYSDSNGSITWDFEILSATLGIYCIDKEELGKFNEYE